jgi:dTDP-4-amino-4,6-dideoxygalactose transaminase
VLQLDIDQLRISRDRFIKKMMERGIETSVHFIPLHLHPYWGSLYGLAPDDLPVAHDVYQRAVSLPIYSRMTDEDIARVITATQTVLTENLKE